MSFSIDQEIVKRYRFPGIGIEMSDEVAKETLLYEVVSLTLSASNHAVALFEVSVEGGFLKGSKEYSFTYSGEGNPLSEAEIKYRAELTGS